MWLEILSRRLLKRYKEKGIKKMDDMMSSGIGTYSVKPADGAREEYEGAGERGGR